ncbi:MAG TPA: bifunctional diaminohydroxyphosphoribosylaminopyrimidine deaminase/5-amino-6-(5-phosphoribosylamino)uracil reductase RibD, partial [Gemmatimonadales bacterium]|nr:bifunctional diaminohydroxyphosphoribosylaminopyrimidine deaminase/5-amino-6-(5-phosphoribosylamino)uracil reductase RibD [Gemmatimonadales bacterium]
MARALDLAWRGWGRVHPNPLVGAVLLDRRGEVLGEGWHAEYGGPHAEAAALAAAGDRARGATLVVTLEPCAHQGKTPPCADAVIGAGVRRVVAALADPDPVAAGGAARLRAAGVGVEIGLLAERAAAQNAAFLHALAVSSRPFVALKLATSVDFRIADSSGRSRWVSGPAAREYVHWLRAGFDAVAVGAG